MAHTDSRADIPIGRLGFVNVANYSKTPIEGALQAEGIDVIQGIVHREPGNVAYNASPLADIQFLDGIEYFPTPSTKRLVVAVQHTVATIEGRLLKDDGTGAFATTLKTGLTFTNGMKFVECGAESAGRNKKLFFFTGADPVQVLSGDGATTANITAPPADWTGANQPFFGTLHRNCVWGGGNANDRHRIYKSLATDHEDFTTTPFSISVFPGEGDSLAGAVSYNGRLFLFKKPAGIYWLDDTSTTPSDWGVKRLVTTVGVANPNLIAETEEDLTFVDHELHMFTLTTVQEFGDVKPRNMLEAFNVDQWLVGIVNKAGGFGGMAFSPKLMWHHTRRNLIFSAPKVGGGYVRLSIDFRESPRKITYSFRDPHEFSTMWTNSSGVAEHLYGFNGTLYRENQTSRRAASVSNGPWISRYQIPHTDFSFVDEGLTGIRKRLRWLTLESPATISQVVQGDVYLDGIYKYTLTIQFTALGGFILDASRLNVDHLGGMPITSMSKRLRGSCERVSIIFYTNDPEADIALGDVTVRFKRSTIRQRRSL